MNGTLRTVKLNICSPFTTNHLTYAKIQKSASKTGGNDKLKLKLQSTP